MGDGDKVMVPMEALSWSTEGAATGQFAGNGLILILNFLRWSSSSSDSSEEKKCALILGAGGRGNVKDQKWLRKRRAAFRLSLG